VLYDKLIILKLVINQFFIFFILLMQIHFQFTGIMKQHWLRTILLMIRGVVICVSIIQLLRYLFLDLVGGFFLAVRIGVMVILF